MKQKRRGARGCPEAVPNMPPVEQARDKHATDSANKDIVTELAIGTHNPRPHKHVAFASATCADITRLRRCTAHGLDWLAPVVRVKLPESENAMRELISQKLGARHCQSNVSGRALHHGKACGAMDASR